MVLGAAPGSDMGATASVSCRHWSSPPEARVAAMKVARAHLLRIPLPPSALKFIHPIAGGQRRRGFPRFG